MLSFSGTAKIYLYRGITDMRRSFNGLCGLVEEHFPGQLLQNSYFIFSNRRRNFVKIIYFDKDGLAIWYKRLEKGKFNLPGDGEKAVLDRRELMLLLEGVTPLKIESRFCL